MTVRRLRPEAGRADFPLAAADLRRLAQSTLLEDRARDDITTAAIVPGDQRGRGLIVAGAQGLIAGLPVAAAVLAAADPSLAWRPHLEDGDPVSPGDCVAAVEGRLAPILRAERVVLNYLGHLSGVATATAGVVQALRGTSCRLRDTRKTLPGLRALEKYAVRVGGGTNHRLNLAEGVLIKDNHLAALRARAVPAGRQGLGVVDAVRLARQANPNMTVEIEVSSVDEARQALDAGADELLLDNMSLDQIREAVALAAGRDPRRLLEASGGITLANARRVAETGVDFISMGAITHSAPALDMSLEVQTG